MTDVSPVPPEEFASALGRLDRDEFAAFVGALWGSEAGVAVDVNGPIVTVGEGTDRQTLLVDPPRSAADEVDTEPDAVVRSDDEPSEDSPERGSEVSVLTPTDLRTRLLYALPSEDAESLCEDFLGLSARSSAYPSVRSGPQEPSGKTAGESPGKTAEQTPSSAVPTSESAELRPTGPTANSVREGPSSPGATATGDTSTGSSVPDSPSSTADQRRSSALATPITPRRIAAVVLVLFVAVGGAVAVGGLSPGDPMSALSGAGDGASGAAAPSSGATATEVEPTTAAPGTSTGAGMEAEAVDGSNTTENDSIDRLKRVVIRGDTTSEDTPVSETVRNTRPAPSCNRSFLLVTQIQTNALRYNDNESDEGIQTIRRFASPTNRRAIDSFSEYREVIYGPTYAALLSWDTVRYEPERLSDDAARVGVVTRENGTVTGRYDFYLQRIDEGEYDGCWMTDAVLTQSSG